MALTRARHACWLGVADLKDGQKKASGLHKSAFGYVLGGGEPVRARRLPAQLRQLCEGQSDIQLDELAGGGLGHARHRAGPAPTPAMQPARSYHGQPVEPWWIASYSALRVASDDDAPTPQRTGNRPTGRAGRSPGRRTARQRDGIGNATSGMHAFPRGAEAGTFLHDLLEWAANEGFAATAQHRRALRNLIERRCQRRGWDAWAACAGLVAGFLRTPLPLPEGAAVSLADADACRAEMEFWFEARHVDTQALDRLVSTHTLGARPRDRRCWPTGSTACSRASST